jgi:hypothetical protein
MTKDFLELSAPEKILVTRLSKNEPLPVINSWLEFNSYNPLTPEGLEKMRIKHNDLINDLALTTDSRGVLNELVDIKDKLVEFSKRVEDPKDLAQISNSLNTVSKTIDDFIERRKGIEGDNNIKPEEFIEVLLYLQSEGYITFPEGKLDALRLTLINESL